MHILTKALIVVLALGTGGACTAPSIAAVEDVEACEKIRVLTIAPLLAEAIRRIADESSVSSLFD